MALLRATGTMQVIDIPSSPEPMPRRTRSASCQPGPSRKRARTAAREPSVVEVIELTDSDDERAVCRPHRLQQGPSQSASSGTALAFGKPNPEVLAEAPVSASGSSTHVAGLHHGGPLFLPGSDDHHHVIRPIPPAQYVPAPAHPQPPPPATVVGPRQEANLERYFEFVPERHGIPIPVARDVPGPAPAHPVPAAPQPFIPVDPVDGYIVRVLEIVPDVQPVYALMLIEQFMHTEPGNVVEFVLHALFENPSYPKTDQKGKQKREEPEDVPDPRSAPKPQVDYADRDRVYDCGPQYFERSLEQLMMDFPRIPKPYLRARLYQNRFYAPTHLFLAEELTKDPLPFKLKSTNSVVGKGKIKEDPEFDKEREWLLQRLAELATERDAILAASVNEKEYEDTGQGIECGCCFSEYPFDQMIQCPEAHLFCKSCMTSYASNLLGEHNPSIVCMDQSGCKLPFPESELGRFLSSKLLELYHRVKQRKEIEAAGLENLEECPFCEYKCVMDNEAEKLFRCENADCGAISCRLCKKPDHLPKTCKEVEEDKHLDAQHIIEEAMTQALMRNCPKCQKSFIKEMGCNKMVCPNCHTVSCYICRKVISGYEHFSNPPPYTNTNKVDKSKCNLWDPVEQRHAEEVSEAAKRALAELRKTRPDVDESAIKVDIPVAQAQALPRPQPGFPPGGGGRFPGYPPGMGMPVPGVVRLGAAAAAGQALGPGVGMGIGPGAGVGVGVGPGPGPGMRAGVGNGIGPGMGPGIGPGAGPDPGFMFGANQAHPFMPFGAQRLRLLAQEHARQAVVPAPVVPQAQPRAGMHAGPVAVPVAGGTRAARAGLHAGPVLIPAGAPPQPPVAAGGGGRRRKGR